MNITKEISLFKMSAKVEMMDRMNSAFAFSLVTIGSLLRIGVSLIFFQSLFLQVREIGGWNQSQVLTLQGVCTFIDGVAWATYFRGFNRVHHFVENGEFDFLLTKPVNLRFFFIYRYMDAFFSLPQILLGIGIILYSLEFNVQLFFLFPQFFIFLLSAFVIQYSMVVMLSSINFFQIVPQTYELFLQMPKLGQYPIEIYRGVWRIIFSIFVPLAFIYSVPAQALFSPLSPLYLMASVFLAIVFYFGSKFIWNFGVNHYESAKG